MGMRVIMAGGGTGGHIYPAIAIADRIKERTFDSEILFVGTMHGLEKELVPKNGYDIKFITASGINRKSIVKNIKVARDYRKGKKQAKKIIEAFKPDVVIGTGGYVCGSVVKLAAKMGIKTYIHEQNAVPGLTNKILEKYVNTVFLGFEEGEKYFKQPKKHIVSGNPVRDAFFDVNKADSRKKLKIEDDDFVVLSFGGSQGAIKMNRAMLDVIEKYNRMAKTRVFFATGKRYYKAVLKEIDDRGITLADNIQILEYINDMQYYLSAADVVISRSGALAVSEIAVCGVPSILIPSPNVTGNHQMFNAKAIADKEGGVLIEEKNLVDGILLKTVEELHNDEEKREEMSINARKCAPLDAADIIYYSIIND